MGRIENLCRMVRIELREFRKYLKENPARAIGAGVLLLIAGWGSVMNHWDLVIGAHEPWYFFSDLIRDISPELAGIVIGALTIDYFNARRQEDQLKSQLVLQMGSQHNDVTDTAVRTLRAYGWLTDGSLKGKDLSYANLKGIALNCANLEGADLTAAKLEGAGLLKARMTGANLWGANLTNALLSDADLTDANLMWANLKGADFSAYPPKWIPGGLAPERTIEHLSKAKHLEGATMPDGVKLGDVFGTDGPTFDEWSEAFLQAYERANWTYRIPRQLEENQLGDLAASVSRASWTAMEKEIEAARSSLSDEEE